MGRFLVVGAITLGGCYAGFEGSVVGGSTGAAPHEPARPDGTSSSTMPDVDPELETSSTGGSEAEGSESDDDGGESSTTGDAALDESSSTGEPLTGCAAIPDALLCEDFEQGEIDPARWSISETNGGSLAVEGGAAVSGRFALHLHLESAEAGHASIRTLPDVVFPVASNHVFGRAWILIESAVPNTHSFLLSTEGPLDGSTARYRLDSNGGRLNSRYTHASVEEHGGWRKMGRHAETDAWICLEWEHDGANNEMRYWFDGELDADMEVLASEDPPWSAPAFQRFEIGFHTYQQPAEPSYDIWYDDIVLATERIGC